MSQENVEMIRQQCAWMAGYPYVLGEMSFIDSDAVYEDALLPDHAGETYHGHDGMRMAWALATEPWDNFKCQLEWARDAGDMVVSGHRVSGRGKGSGIEMEAHYAYVWVFRQNKVVHLTAYLDRAEALDPPGCRSSAQGLAQRSPGIPFSARSGILLAEEFFSRKTGAVIAFQEVQGTDPRPPFRSAQVCSGVVIPRGAYSVGSAEALPRLEL